MKMYLLSDDIDTLTGMRLAGVEGYMIHGKAEFEEKLSSVMEDREIGVLLISRALYGEHSEIIDEIKLSTSLPLIVNIPDRYGGTGTDITSYISKAIGLKI
jgi:V/A-type H+-transporting ATPase subunit F